MSDDIPPKTEAPWAAGWRSAKANLLPGFILQLFALSLVLAYYFHAPTRAWCEKLSAIRQEEGFLFSIVSTAIFGGVLPGLYLKLNPATRNRYDFKQLAFLVGLWAYRGFEVDLFYSLLAKFVGAVASPGVVVTKMAIDQFVYSPLIAVPVSYFAYFWCDSHFNTKALVADYRTRHWYLRKVLPMLIANLGVWLPSVAIIYSLPSPLQLPLFDLVLCFFTLLLAHLTRKSGQARG